MKKFSILLILLLSLVACSSNSVGPVSDEFLFSVDGNEITEGQLFKSMKLSSGSTEIIREKAQKTLLRSIVEEDEAFDAKVAEVLAEAKEMMGDNFETTIQQNGFDSEEEYIEEIIKDVARLHIGLTNAISEDYESLKYTRPRKVKLLEVAQEDSQKVLELLKAEEDFDEVAKKYRVESSQFTKDEILISEVTQIDVKILNPLLNEENTGLFEEIIETDQGQFILATITNVDADALKDEAVESFVLNNDMSQEYLAKMFIDYKFKIYDQGLHDSFTERYPDFIK